MVFALYINDRDSGVFQQAQARKCVIHRLGRHVSFMEKIAAHYHKIDLFIDSVFLQHIHPRIEKIARALRQLVARAAQVHVRDMEEFHGVNYSRRLGIKPE
jgi:hypothetical protein